MKKTILLSLLVCLLSVSFASAWLDYTHQWICDKAGLSQYNCSLADNADFQKAHPGTANTYHLCINNSDRCSARTKADHFFPTHPEVSLHLWADSMTPAHWHNFGFEGCHLEFESCVDSKLKFGSIGWNCSLECSELGTFKKYNMTADYPYMLSVVDYVKQQYALHKQREIIYKIIIASLSIIAVLFIVFYRKRS